MVGSRSGVNSEEADMATEPQELSAEETARMRRLQDEIVARYAEMAMILGRALGSPGLVSRATQPGARLTLAFKSEDRTTTQLRDGYICVEVDGGAWEDPPGWCREGGCF